MGFLPRSVHFYSLYCSDVVNTMSGLSRAILVLQMKTLRRCSSTSCEVMVLGFSLPSKHQLTLPRLWAGVEPTHTCTAVTVGSAGLDSHYPCSLGSAPAPSSTASGQLYMVFSVMLGDPLPTSGASSVTTGPRLASSSQPPTGPGAIPTLRHRLGRELSSATARGGETEVMRRCSGNALTEYHWAAISPSVS